MSFCYGRYVLFKGFLGSALDQFTWVLPTSKKGMLNKMRTLYNVIVALRTLLESGTFWNRHPHPILWMKKFLESLGQETVDFSKEEAIDLASILTTFWHSAVSTSPKTFLSVLLVVSGLSWALTLYFPNLFHWDLFMRLERSNTKLYSLIMSSGRIFGYSLRIDTGSNQANSFFYLWRFYELYKDFLGLTLDPSMSPDAIFRFLEAVSGIFVLFSGWKLRPKLCCCFNFR